ncbi:MAG: hypothetical protein NTV11_00770 [Rhodocyclales bacterium]|nr:hypothetical protein [Rhodocyclales bacterium]
MVDGNKKEKKGFAGLNQLVSDVEPVTPAPEHEVKTDNTRQAEPAKAEPTQQIFYGTQQSGPSSNGKYWAIGIGVLVLLIVIGNSDSNKSTPNRSVATAPSYSPPPAYEAPAYVPQAPAPAYAPPEAIAPLAVDDEEIPPVGSGLAFNDAQMRYCLSEKIRVATWQGYINNYSETSVGAFNEAVDDYNARCSHFRYRSGALERVRGQVEQNQYTLQRQGMDKAQANP